MKTLLATVALVVPFAVFACSSPNGEGAPAEANQAQITPLVAEVQGVKTSCTEEGRYYVSDGVVSDRANGGLLWQQEVTEKLFTHEEAVAYCASSQLGWRGPWRLPTVQELNEIKLNAPGLKGGPETCSPSIDQSAFPNTPLADFWTATLRPDQGDAIYVGFDDGRDHPSTLDTPMNVRCVADP